MKRQLQTHLVARRKCTKCTRKEKRREALFAKSLGVHCENVRGTREEPCRRTMMVKFHEIIRELDGFLVAYAHRDVSTGKLTEHYSRTGQIPSGSSRGDAR